MLNKLPRFRSTTLATMLLWGATAAIAPVFGDDLAQELKKVPYKIAFESRQDRNWDLFTIRADGSDRVNLTRTPEVNELCPHVSADGTKVCFVVDEGEAERTVRSVWCMNLDGTGRRLIARGGREPCWAAGDRGIVYLKSEFEAFTAMDYATKGLFVYDMASGHVREHPNPEIQHLYCACCTPDGKWYLSTVHAGLGCTHAILAIEAQGRKVVDLKIPGCRPDVSPDGKRIAWASGNFSLAVGDLDFSGPEPRVVNAHDILTSPKPMKIQHIDWSPDGRYVAFSRGPYKKGLGLAPSLVGVPAPGWNICVADPSTTNRWVAITTDGASNKEPDWVPITNPIAAGQNAHADAHHPPASPAVRLKPAQELSVAACNGAELFFADLDHDGRPEVLAYQGPAVFGARLYSAWPQVKPALPKSTCLIAFRQDGTRLWTWGTPNPPDRPYTSHAFESCAAAGDVDGDGRVEVALADGRKIYLFDGLTGRVRAEAEMPEDNFYIVQVLGQRVAPGEAAVVVKNGEGGYAQWRYGEPLLALDAQLKQVWGPVAIPGAGHHILSLDLDGDNANEFLIGYCAVKPSGKIAWTVDAIDPAKLSPDKQHVDYTDVRRLPSGEMLLGLAGSNRSYLVERGGRTRFANPGPHTQGCALGRFRDDSEYQMAVYNAPDGPMVLYDAGGKELWQRPTPRRWPLGCPKACDGRVFHRNGPIKALSIPRAGKPAKDYVIYSDGGWPWGMDGDGNIALEFEPPANSRQPERELPPRARADDLGYGFATKIVDWDGDGANEAVIYDRRWLWVYDVEKSVP